MNEEDRLRMLGSYGLLAPLYAAGPQYPAGPQYAIAPLGIATGASNPASASAAEGYAGALGFNIGPRGGLVYRPWEFETWRDTGIPMELWNAGGGYGSGYGGGYGGGYIYGNSGGLLGQGLIPPTPPSGVRADGTGSVSGNGNGDPTMHTAVIVDYENPDTGNEDTDQDPVSISPFWDYDPTDPTQWHPPSTGGFVLDPHDPTPPFTQWQQHEHDRIQEENRIRELVSQYSGPGVRGFTPPTTVTQPQRALTFIPPATSMGAGLLGGYVPGATTVTQPVVQTIAPGFENRELSNMGGASASDLARIAREDQDREDARRAQDARERAIHTGAASGPATNPVVTVVTEGAGTDDSGTDWDQHQAAIDAHNRLFPSGKGSYVGMPVGLSGPR